MAEGPLLPLPTVEKVAVEGVRFEVKVLAYMLFAVGACVG
jgi:hypothetical protein